MRFRLAIIGGCAAILAALFPRIATAAFPTDVFSPYMEIDAGDNLQISNVLSATAQKYYTMAFVIPDSSDNPTWGGTGHSVASGFYSSQITSIRNSGGDVICSFGGASGGELALNATTASALQAQYQAVINKYNFTWLDFDIEGSTLSNTPANQLRNTALVALQAANPGLQITYTLPGDPNGLDSTSRALLNDAKSKGLKIRDVNVMAMDFGTSFTSGKTESSVAISTANKVHTQVSAIDSTIDVGITVMIGQNDEPEVFQLSDAPTLLTFATSNSWVDEIGMWSANRDNGTSVNTNANDLHSGIIQSTWAFTNSFKSFSTVPEPSSLALAGLGALGFSGVVFRRIRAPRSGK